MKETIALSSLAKSKGGGKDRGCKWICEGYTIDEGPLVRGISVFAPPRNALTPFLNFSHANIKVNEARKEAIRDPLS